MSYTTDCAVSFSAENAIKSKRAKTEGRNFEYTFFIIKYFVQIYLDRVRSIVINLNQNVIEQINDGSIKPHVVAFMTHQELSPEKWKDLIETKTKRDKNKFETKISAATDTFTCRKCKGNQCTYYQMQTRSADEPMSCYVNCILCGNRWKC